MDRSFNMFLVGGDAAGDELPAQGLRLVLDRHDLPGDQGRHGVYPGIYRIPYFLLHFPKGSREGDGLKKI